MSFESGAKAGQSGERNQEATCYCGNLDEAVSDELLWELMLQVGPVVSVHIPKDRITNVQQAFGFVEFRSEEDADYAVKIMNMIKVFGKPIRVNKASADKKSNEVGGNLFIGNLAGEVDEKLLYDTFSAFGAVIDTPRIMRDPETGNSRGFGFVKFDTFDAADAAIEAMSGQFLQNQAITVQYAYKKDSVGERHGSVAERIIASTSNAKAQRPHQLFAASASGANAPPMQIQQGPPPGMMPPGMVPPGFAPPGMAPPGMAPPPGLGGPMGGMGGPVRGLLVLVLVLLLWCCWCCCCWCCCCWYCRCCCWWWCCWRCCC